MRSDAFPPAKLAIIPEITNLFGKNIQKQFRLYEIPRKKKNLIAAYIPKNICNLAA